MAGSKIIWIIVSPLIVANLIWFYLTVSAWTKDHDHDSLALMGVQLGITFVLGALPVIRAYVEDKQFKASRQRQARSKRVAWQADKLDNLSE